jgi:hypothetical protein
MIRPWISRTLLLLAVFAACWTGTVWRWRGDNHVPSTADLALYLLVQPLVVLLLIWLGKKLLTLALAAPAAAAADAPAAGDAAQAPAATPAASSATAPLTVLAGALRMPHGASASELSDKVLANAAHLELDPELTDAEGFPVMSARVPELDGAEQQALMAPWLQQHAAGMPPLSDEQYRALALGSAVATELAHSASTHRLLAPYLAAAGAARAAVALPVLQVAPLLPANWDQAQRLCAGMWFLHVIEQAGWPASRLSLSGAAARADATALPVIEQLALQSEREALPCLAIVLTCASHIGDASVDEWAARGTLFSAKNPLGQVPGEGAAGLLLADAAQAAQLASESQVRLHRAFHGKRETSADAPGRVAGTVLAELSTQALQAGAVSAGQIGFVAADTGHHASRNGELFGMVHSTLPELDPASQLIGVAASCGNAGAVSAMAALVLGCTHVAQQAGHALCVSNQDPYQRCAVLLGPADTAVA